MGFDLSSIELINGGVADVEILHPLTGEKTGMIFKVAGRDSDHHEMILQGQQREAFAKAQEGRLQKATPEDVRASTETILVQSVLGWEGVVENGEPVPFSSENITRIFSQHKWLKEQVDRALGNRKLFLKG